MVDPRWTIILARRSIADARKMGPDLHDFIVKYASTIALPTGNANEMTSAKPMHNQRGSVCRPPELLVLLKHELGHTTAGFVRLVSLNLGMVAC